MDELLARAEKYIRIEDSLKTSKIDAPPKKRVDEEGAKYKKGRRPPPPPGPEKYTPLAIPREAVLAIAEQQGIIERPPPLKFFYGPPKSNDYCRFHREKGHTTDKCRQLKIAIEELIQQGHLQEVIATKQGGGRQTQQRQKGGNKQKGKGPKAEAAQHDEDDDNNQPLEVIGVISGGPSAGDSNSARKAMLRAASNTDASIEATSRQVNHITRGPKGTSIPPMIQFGDADLDANIPPCNDALVIAATIANFMTKRVLVDCGSSADILFYNVFQKMGLLKAQLEPVNTPLYGFAGESVRPLGQISLPVSLGTSPARTTKMVNFTVVQAPSSYNVILGRPSLNNFAAVISTYHMKMKFPTPFGVGEAAGDIKAARACYATTLRPPKSSKGGRQDHGKGCEEALQEKE